ncbi:MAG TPA: DUF4864 domain-containing protein [Devosia sp.]
MSALGHWYRLGLTLLLMLLPDAALAQSQAAVAEEEWQLVITSQVQAFRDRDAAEAMRYAAAAFHTRFATPEEFFIVIMGSGYAPIMDSRSHSFGAFRMIDENTVAQQVRFSGGDQKVYEAIYVLGREEAGWRVQGVQLARTAALGV